MAKLTKRGFQKGSGGFPCGSCGKTTRKNFATLYFISDVNYNFTNVCKKCFDEAMKQEKKIENQMRENKMVEVVKKTMSKNGVELNGK